jgi:hypothetical protein
MYLHNMASAKPTGRPNFLTQMVNQGTDQVRTAIHKQNDLVSLKEAERGSKGSNLSPLNIVQISSISGTPLRQLNNAPQRYNQQNNWVGRKGRDEILSNLGAVDKSMEDKYRFKRAADDMALKTKKGTSASVLPTVSNTGKVIAGSSPLNREQELKKRQEAVWEERHLKLLGNQQRQVPQPKAQDSITENTLASSNEKKLNSNTSTSPTGNENELPSIPSAKGAPKVLEKKIRSSNQYTIAKNKQSIAESSPHGLSSEASPRNAQAQGEVSKRKTQPIKPTTQAPKLVTRKEAAKQKVKQSQLLMHLLHGVVFPKGPTESGYHCRFDVGPGNNQKLVLTTIRNRDSVLLESNHVKCNLVWTQLQDRTIEGLDGNSGLCQTSKEEFMKNNPFHQLNPYAQFLTKSEEDLVNLILLNSRFTISNPKIIANVLHLLYFKSPEQPQKQPSQDLQSPSPNEMDSPIPSSLLLQMNSLPPYGNHLRGLRYLSRKHLLFTTVSSYCHHSNINYLTIMPKTYLVKPTSVETDLKYMFQEKHRSMHGFDIPLIIKPGECSNRGNGIVVVHREDEVRKVVDEIFGGRKNVGTVVIQDYMVKPLLFKQRKFDIRAYALVVKLGRVISYYWYRDGYARTSSFNYDLSDVGNLKVHLTNEAVQVKGKLAITIRQ